MRVLVTGGSGRLGQYTVHELHDHGHEVISADRRSPSWAEPIGVHFVEIDLTDVGQVVRALRGCEAVIHLGAIPAPYGHADEVVFTNNTRATFAVLQASALLGVRRAVIASSVSAYGMAWAPRRAAPLYAPIDEAHPLLVQDPYGLSKEVGERTGAMFSRRHGMTVAALRFHWVALPEELANLKAGIEPTSERLATNLWGYVDVRDAAAACRLSIECDAFGFGAFNITAADTLCALPTEELIRRYLPETELRSSIVGTTTGFSLVTARRVLNWSPRYSWRHMTDCQ